MMDVSGITSLLNGYYQVTSTASLQINSSSIAEQLSSRLLENYDTAGNGYLANSDISSLSSDAFGKLDTNADGKLSSTEIKAAFQKYMDSVSSVSETGGAGAYQTLQSLQSTPEGQLMKALRTTAAAASTDTTQSSTPSSETAVLQASLNAASEARLITDNVTNFDVSV